MADTLIFLLTIGVTAYLPNLGAKWCHAAGRAAGRWASHRKLTVISVAILAGITSLVISLVGTIPTPWCHDEFSYLLAADTFAHGRVTNPPHPLSAHFESAHILVQPTYTSLFQPGQGALLAIGIRLGGHPIVGVWLGAILSGGAVVWMLLGWLRPRWALLGGLLAATHPSLLRWSQFYMGGALGLLGGALVLGALPRLRRNPSVSTTIPLGLGIAILANSRPYEGLILTILCLASLAIWTLRSNGELRRLILTRVLPVLILILSLIAAQIAYYNWRVTGNPLLLPYRLQRATYAVAPHFYLWETPRPEPHYRHRELYDLHIGWELEQYRQHLVAGNLPRITWQKLRVLIDGYFPMYLIGIPPGAILILLATLPWLLRNPNIQWAMLLFGIFTAAQLIVTFVNVHYTGPIFGLVFLIAVQALRHLRLWRWRGRKSGRSLVRIALLLWLLMLIPTYRTLAQIHQQQWGHWRTEILRDLQHTGEKHLVLVRYGAHRLPSEDWVYNDADIDQAQVVWAHEMDPDSNRRLLEYFKGRRTWLLDCGVLPRQLVPYPKLTD